MRITLDKLDNTLSSILVSKQTYDLCSSTSKLDEYYILNRDRFINVLEPQLKIRYKPLNFNEILLKLHDQNGNELYYADLGFSNDDIRFRRNRFTKSFIRMDLYDTPEPFNQKLIESVEVFCRIDLNQLDVNQQPLDVSAMPVDVTLYDPVRYRGRKGRGYNIYANPTDELYVYYYFANALNGQIIPFHSSTLTLTPQNVLENNYLKINLSSNLRLYSFDTTDRNTSTIQNPRRLTINLNKIEI